MAVGFDMSRFTLMAPAAPGAPAAATAAAAVPEFAFLLEGGIEDWDGLLSFVNKEVRDEDKVPGPAMMEREDDEGAWE
jgi:hypothetical protein